MPIKPLFLIVMMTVLFNDIIKRLLAHAVQHAVSKKASLPIGTRLRVTRILARSRISRNLPVQSDNQYKQDGIVGQIPIQDPSIHFANGETVSKTTEVKYLGFLISPGPLRPRLSSNIE